ncbi:NUDIX hydrolase [Falsibacillus albus]|uniref:NUDIX hydrolase n=1 Tax=Falsibacillus albus TaxID=2478915 RepID=A0A3L7K9Z2_9BACI|nr:NUDIX hydrolase [Falsibacillus albus]RLQ97472.1 NUDIX hydrolase [Falsibacillus albus]
MKRVDVAYALIFAKGKILMVKNRGPKGSYYTLPGGAVEEGETLQEGAIREVKEETGYDAEVGQICAVTEARFENSGHHVVFFTFIGKVIGGVAGISHPDEIEEVTWMQIEEAKKQLTMYEDLEALLRESRAPYSWKGHVTDHI